MVTTRRQSQQYSSAVVIEDDTTNVSGSSHTLEQESTTSNSTTTKTLNASSSSSSSSEDDSSSDDNSSDDDDDDDSSDEEDDLDDETHEKLKSLLLKARQAATAASDAEGKAKADQDALANNDEMIKFGDDEEEDDDGDSDVEDSDEDDEHDEEATTPKASSSSGPILPRSLVAPLRVSSKLSTIDGKSTRPDNIKPETSMRDAAIVNASNSGEGKIIKGDRWGMMPMKSLSKKEMKARHPPTAGPQWFNMPAPTVTPQLKREIQAMRLRNALDPKRFYRGDAAKADAKLPEYFQVGHVLGETHRASNAPIGKASKRTFVEELVEDEQAKAYTKRKTAEVMRKGMSGRKGKAKRRKV